MGQCTVLGGDYNTILFFDEPIVVEQILLLFPPDTIVKILRIII